MNKYLRNTDRIEFVVTMACTGKCRHCSEGDHSGHTGHIDTETAVNSIRKICENYKIGTLMTFGGEPLLYPDVIYSIHRTAAAFGIGRRQLITNGFFSNKRDRIEEVTKNLADCGINDLLLSADAFHQETIPLEPVRFFAECAIRSGIPVRLSPAWLVSPDDHNPYNDRTREILRKFEPLQIPVGGGNVVFPQGNALKYLRDYFDENVEEFSPYEEDPEDIRTISFSQNGDVLNGNIYRSDILEIIRTYRPSN